MRHFAVRSLRFQMQDEKMMHSHAGLQVIILACKPEAQPLAWPCSKDKYQTNVGRPRPNAVLPLTLTPVMPRKVGNLFKIALIRKEKLLSIFSNMNPNDLQRHPNRVSLTAVPIKGNVY